TQSAAYIAGIDGTALTGSNVVVNANGQLGIVMSSASYKRAIRDIGAASSALMELRPVTFRYRNDPLNVRQYGLVAQQVRQVSGAGDGWRGWKGRDGALFDAYPLAAQRDAQRRPRRCATLRGTTRRRL